MGTTSESDGGRLVLVATPIGNLGDLSPRAADTLAAADLVACEDTRRTGRLLAHIGVSAPLVAVHDHNEAVRAAHLCDRVAAGDVVALVTDAGTPGISDPGFEVVRAAVDRDLVVRAVPGPAAVVQALVLSGLPTDRFAFEGFLPRKAGSRWRRLAAIADDERTLIFYVAPHRAAADLAAMARAFGDERPAVVARELTKLHEQTLRGTLGTLAQRLAAEPLRGEVTVVVGGAPPQSSEPPTDEEVRSRVDAVVADGSSRRDAVRQVAEETGLPRRRVYEAATA